MKKLGSRSMACSRSRAASVRFSAGRTLAALRHQRFWLACKDRKQRYSDVGRSSIASFSFGERCALQLRHDLFGQFAFDRENIGQFAVVMLGPHDAHRCGRRLIARSRAHDCPTRCTLPSRMCATPSAVCDVAQIARPAGGYTALRTVPADDFQDRRLLRKRWQNFILHAFGEVGVLLIVTQVLKRQYRDAFLGNRRSVFRRNFGRTERCLSIKKYPASARPAKITAAITTGHRPIRPRKRTRSLVTVLFKPPRHRGVTDFAIIEINEYDFRPVLQYTFSDLIKMRAPASNTRPDLPPHAWREGCARHRRNSSRVPRC